MAEIEHDRTEELGLQLCTLLIGSTAAMAVPIVVYLATGADFNKPFENPTDFVAFWTTATTFSVLLGATAALLSDTQWYYQQIEALGQRPDEPPYAKRLINFLTTFPDKFSGWKNA